MGRITVDSDPQDRRRGGPGRAGGRRRGPARAARRPRAGRRDAPDVRAPARRARPAPARPRRAPRGDRAPDPASPPTRSSRAGIARLTLLGDERSRARQAAAELGVDVSGGRPSSTRRPARCARSFAHEYARLRAHKGVTLDQARDRVLDPSYFGTMMVHLGLADGMVSGCITTTAHTIRPALEVVRTAARRVGRVAACSSCASPTGCSSTATAPSTPTPRPSSSPTSRSPRRARHERSASSPGWRCCPTRRASRAPAPTSTRCAGSDGARARASARAARGGPDPVRRGRRPRRGARPSSRTAPSPAGRRCWSSPTSTPATTPTRRSSAARPAVAIGPVLQGLNRPVNDLSRGALVRDIVNTIAITAIQAAG